MWISDSIERILRIIVPDVEGRDEGDQTPLKVSCVSVSPTLRDGMGVCMYESMHQPPSLQSSAPAGHSINVSSSLNTLCPQFTTWP